MAYDTITYATEGPVALITLNRPDRLNAWTPHMSEEQADAIERANADRSVGAIVMTGAGRGFCAGADIEHTFKSRLDGVDPGKDTGGGSGGLPRGLDWIDLCRRSKPLVAAVNGPAVGIGVTMILPFDIIIAGAEAYERGLANALAAPETLLAKAFETATQIAANPDPMLRMTKDLLTQNACEQDMALAQRRETDYLKQCWTMAEHKEAVSAFMEKRPARFR